MGKLFFKNKKILFLLGFVLFLSLIIPHFALAIDCGTCDIYGAGCNPGCESSVDAWGVCTCNEITTIEETSNFCPGALPFVSWAWWKCILEFIASLPFKIPFFFVAGLGIALAILGGLLLLFLQGIAGQLIYYSLNLTSKVPFNIATIAGEVRNLALQLLFLFLAIIGLATILKIQEYQFRKALVPLIVVALLINFSTPIVVAIVNIGNSLTNAFFTWGEITPGPDLRIIEPSELLDTIKTGLKALVLITLQNGKFFEHIDESIIQLTSLAAIGFIIALFYIAAALVIAIFGLIFFMRVVFIWLLIIIAPIAFVTAIFKTKEIKAILPGPLNWDTWWEWLLEWSFMGVGLALWLALAMKLKVAGKVLFPYIPPSDLPLEISGGVYQDMVKTVFGNMFGYLAALVALWIGVTTAPGMMGQMTSQAFGKAKGFVTAVAAGGAIAMGAGAIAGFKGGFGNQWKKRLEGLKEGEKPSVGKTLKAGVSGVGAGLSSGLATMTRRGLGEGLAGIAKPIPAEIKKEAAPFWLKREFITGKEEAKKYVEESYEREGPKGVENIVKSKSVTDELRIAALNKLLEEKKVSKELVENPEGQRIILSDYEETARLGNTKKTAKMERAALSLGEDFGEIARKTGIYTDDKEKKDKAMGIDTYTKKIIASVKTAGDVEELQKSWWDEKENPGAMDTAEKFWTGNQWAAAGREFGKDIVDALESTIDKLREFKKNNNEDRYKDFVRQRPGLARYSETGAAQELGFSSFYDLAPEAIKFKEEERVVEGKVVKIKIPRYENIREILAEKPVPTPPPPAPPSPAPPPPAPGRPPYGPTAPGAPSRRLPGRT